MITEHNPWGRPGAGAPNNEIRMTNIIQKGLYPVGSDVSNACFIMYIKKLS